MWLLFITYSFHTGGTQWVNKLEESFPWSGSTQGLSPGRVVGHFTTHMCTPLLCGGKGQLKALQGEGDAAAAGILAQLALLQDQLTPMQKQRQT